MFSEVLKEIKGRLFATSVLTASTAEQKAWSKNLE